MSSAKLSQKHQIVIPREIRASLQLTAGSVISILALDNHRAMIVAEPKSAVAALKGLGAEEWTKLGGASKYIHEERKSWKK